MKNICYTPIFIEQYNLFLNLFFKINSCKNRIFYFIFLLISLFSCKIEELKTPPIVKTNSSSEITSTSAKIWGEVVEEGSSSATERGFVYSEKNPSPSTSDNKVSTGFGKGEYNLVISKLTPKTKYYFKAYASNQTGISYGDAKDFTTLEDFKLPTLITSPSTNITFNSCTTGGIISSNGGAAILEKGVVYSTSSNPTISNNKQISTDPNNSFSLVLTGLVENTTYYARAFATNSVGTNYGEQIVFITPKNYDLLLKNGLVAYYPFNGNAKDASGNGYDGVAINVTLTSDRNNVNNAAYLFNKSSIDLGVLPKLGNSPTSFTKSVWILADGNQNNFCKMPILSKRQKDSDKWFSFGGGGNGTVDVPWKEQAYFFADGGGYASGIANASYSSSKTNDNKWHHLVAIKDKNSLRLYFDGNLESSKTDNLEVNSSSNMTLGYQAVWGFECERYFFGKIDDVGIWNRVLSNEEIQYLLKNRFTP